MVKEFPDTTNSVSYEYVKINSMGISDDSGAHILRSHGRVDYHLLYAVEDGFTALTDEGRVTLSAGQAYFYAPGERQEYIHGGKTLWVHFSGVGVPAIAERLSLPRHGVLFPSDKAETEALFYKALTAHYSERAGQEIIASSLIPCLLVLLSPVSGEDSDGGSVSAVKRAVELMHTESVPFSIKRYASLCNLSESRFCHIFTSVTGISPLKYYNKIKLESAKNLLKNTDMSVKKIAYALGYDDEFYFSRLFKKTYGLSPKAFRSS